MDLSFNYVNKNSDSSAIPTEEILGIPISNLGLDAIVGKAIHAIENSLPPFHVFFANPHSLNVSRNDYVFRKALKGANIVTADGIGIIVASKLRGGCLKQRITGSDFFSAISDFCNRRGNIRYYFLGASEATLKSLRHQLEKKYPFVIWAGEYAPAYKDEFTEEENAAMIAAINRSKADILWVGMTAPKQEKWVYQNAPFLNVRVIGAIGAVFDYFSGKVIRPGRLWRKYGLEWFPRLLANPKRLWKRTFISLPQFLFFALYARTQNDKVKGH